MPGCLSSLCYKGSSLLRWLDQSGNLHPCVVVSVISDRGKKATLSHSLLLPSGVFCLIEEDENHGNKNLLFLILKPSAIGRKLAHFSLSVRAVPSFCQCRVGNLSDVPPHLCLLSLYEINHLFAVLPCSCYVLLCVFHM